MSIRKATRRPLLTGKQEVIFAPFRFRCRLRRGFLLFRCRVELDGYHRDAIMLDVVFVCPSFGLEIALHGKQGAFGQVVERPFVLVFAPRLKIQESGHPAGLIAGLLLTAYGQGETCYTCAGETADFSVLTYETCHCECVLNLFHNSMLLEVKQINFTMPKKVGVAKGCTKDCQQILFIFGPPKPQAR